MLITFLKNIPSYRFWIANILFWLVLNTVAATIAYRTGLHYEKPVSWNGIWLEYIPWWGNWAFIAPLIIASTLTIPFNNKKIGLFVFKSIAIMLIILCFYWLLTTVEVALFIHNDLSIERLSKSFSRLLLSPLHMDVLVYLAVFCLGYSFSYYKHSIEQQKKNQILQQQLVQIELQSLKSQLNPHFLFNTLNTIASLIRLDSKTHAITALSELSKMLRKVLENEGQQFISLALEIEFINSYLTIQKMRFENKLVCKIEVNDACLNKEIPFMLLQPLVENAVQHGSQLESNQNQLTLTIDCDEKYLFITLINKMPENDEHQGFGIGVSNCTNRLEKLYNNDFELCLTPLENSYFKTYLKLPKEYKHD